MAWNPPTEAEVEVKKPVTKTLLTKIRDCLFYLFGQISTLSSGDILNGSFEVDSDADNAPDQWVLNTYPGGTVVRDTATSQHGGACVKMTHPGGAGNGGGYAESDYVACSEFMPVLLSLIHYATAAGMKNMVIVRFFDKDKIDLLSNLTVYNTTLNPTSPRRMLFWFAPPVGARFMKVQLVGGYSDTNVAGDAYFDGVTVLDGKLHGALASTPASISEQAVNDINWTDAGSVAVKIPGFGLPVTLSFIAAVRIGALKVAYQRFRVGSNYSNENSSGSSSYESFSYSISLPATAVSSGTVTIVQQLKTSQIGYTAYGTMSLNTPSVRINVASNSF